MATRHLCCSTRFHIMPVRFSFAKSVTPDRCPSRERIVLIPFSWRIISLQYSLSVRFHNAPAASSLATSDETMSSASCSSKARRDETTPLSTICWNASGSSDKFQRRPAQFSLISMLVASSSSHFKASAKTGIAPDSIKVLKLVGLEVISSNTSSAVSFSDTSPSRILAKSIGMSLPFPNLCLNIFLAKWRIPFCFFGNATG
mmetsp:Transcript_34138/g.54679  ORF Transcript_34138/g.54679 Transcript_34138/m.54679 type:complete len:202 (-) Transcript_34138:1112-1717(-)